MKLLLRSGGGLALLALRLGAQPAAPAPLPPAPPLAAYSQFGTSLAQSAHLSQLGWTEAQFDAFIAGMRAAFRGQPVPMDDAGRRLAEQTGRALQDLASGKAAAPAAGPAEPDPAGVQAYYRQLTKRLGLQWSLSGLGYNVSPGASGERPRPGDTVVLSCQALAADTTSPLAPLSSDRVRVKMADLLPGLLEGLQMMTVGSHAVFVLPAQLSFGGGRWPDGVTPGAPIIFKIGLIEVLPAAAAP